MPFSGALLALAANSPRVRRELKALFPGPPGVPFPGALLALPANSPRVRRELKALFSGPAPVLSDTGASPQIAAGALARPPATLRQD